MICCWMPTTNERKCQDMATHWHHAYGEVCPHHAAVLMASGQEVSRLHKHKSGIKTKQTLGDSIGLRKDGEKVQADL